MCCVGEEGGRDIDGCLWLVFILPTVNTGVDDGDGDNRHTGGVRPIIRV